MNIFRNLGSLSGGQNRVIYAFTVQSDHFAEHLKEGIWWKTSWNKTKFYNAVKLKAVTCSVALQTIFVQWLLKTDLHLKQQQRLNGQHLLFF